MLTSPNFPGNYPNNFERTEVIQVESGKILRLEFTHFEVAYGSRCEYGFVKIRDGDGTTLMDKSCGYTTVATDHHHYFMPPMITTKTNTVDIFHHSDGSGVAAGWSLNWTAVTPGLKPPHSTSTHSFLCDSVILSSLISS